EHFSVDREALLLGRKSAAAHFLRVAFQRITDRVTRLGVAFYEGRRKAAEQADDVVEHQHLAVAVRAGADADGGDTDAARDELRELRRHELEHHAPAARLLERDGALHDAPHALLVLALQSIAAERRGGLRCQADMPEHRHAGGYQRRDDRSHLHPAFEL